jgi:hypothetical protein
MGDRDADDDRGPRVSHKLMYHAGAFDVGDATAKLLLMLIARHARDDGTGCVAGQETLATEAHLSERTAREAMGYLERTGIIRRRRRFRKNGTRTSDETLLNVTTTGEICRWSTPDHRQETTETTGRKRRRPPAESAAQEVNQSEESVRGEREGAPTRDDGARPPLTALSLSDAIGKDPELQTRCRTEAATLRPDLTPEQVATSLDRWVHDRTAKASRRVDWLADFKGWIGRERIEAATPTPPAAIVNGKPYRPPAGWERDDMLTDRVGRELGIQPGRYEDYPAFRTRIRDALRANRGNA